MLEYLFNKVEKNSTGVFLGILRNFLRAPFFYRTPVNHDIGSNSMQLINSLVSIAHFL